jgi:hypothetical protein
LAAWGVVADKEKLQTRSMRNTAPADAWKEQCRMEPSEGSYIDGKRQKCNKLKPNAQKYRHIEVKRMRVWSW